MKKINEVVRPTQNEKPVSTSVRQAKRVDLVKALDLVDDAAMTLAHLKLQQTQITVELDSAYETIEQLNKVINAYESERLSLYSALEQSEYRARSYWKSFKTAADELDQLKTAISNRLLER